MNQAFKKAILACIPNQQLGIGTIRSICRIASVTGTETQVPSRKIHNFVRPYRYALRVRRLKEQFKNPERFAKPMPRYSFAEWNHKAEIFAFGKRLGEEFDDALLREALTDQTYIHKEKKKQEELGIDTTSLEMRNNEELSEIGLQLTKDALYQFTQREVPLFPSDGHDALVNYLTNSESITKIAENLGMKDIILCEEYPPSHETYCKAFFAVIGALHGSSGQERVEKFVVDFIASSLCGKDINEIWDIPRPWLTMEMLAKQKNLFPVEPRIISETGKNTIHAVFVVGVYDKNKTLIGKGIGETVDIALEMSARDTLKGFFNTKDPRPPFEFQSTNIPYKLIPLVRNINKG